MKRYLSYLIMLVLLLQVCTVQAQTNTFTEEDVLAVSTLVVNESSFSRSDDPEAITLTISRVSHRLGISPAEYIRRHHRRIGSNQEWIRGLNSEGTEPQGWPENLPWEAYQPRWQAVQARVRRALAGESRITCNATTWGSPRVDADRIARMLSSGEYEYARCGVTRNSFLVRVRPHR